MAELAPREVWRQADAVCFDVDSTLIRIEGIDQLARLCGAEERVTELTRQAMGGSLTFRESLSQRLNIIRPSRDQIEKFKSLHTPDTILTPDVQRLVKLLFQRGAEIYLVSGGFREVIEPLADHLGIPRDHVFANKLLFTENGEYRGFDESQPTSRSGGKPTVVAEIKKKHKTVVMIGDGATDMEASPPADLFIGFGGNVVREKVKEGASWFVYKFQELISELENDSTDS
ncbi:Phosphoserine phosphatase [Geodia barretti]|uniref:Phosphoserine phosphatase n=1 Tax=Geodia barretti TaxID=519541 RepID=A0AA35W5F9_GEOBA|nr:Phosphoserine phosphatase [Geodia barretti]